MTRAQPCQIEAFASPSGTALPSFYSRGCLTDREHRVLWLVIVVVVLSIVDLYLTLLYARSVGMGEGNPFARWMMQNWSPATVALWKLVLVTGAAGILAGTRRYRCAEIGAWIACLIMIWLTVRWSNYIHEFHELTPHFYKLSCSPADNWVHMTN